jgi:hypothetical protein
VSTPRLTYEAAMTRARDALRSISIIIDYDEDEGSTGEVNVEHGLDAMASALSDLKGLDLGAAPLDKVLAEAGEDKELIEMTAELIERIGRRSYTGISREDAEVAEDLRGQVYDALGEILQRLGERAGDG